MKNFTKEDLKNGMVIELRNGSKRVYWNGNLVDEIGYSTIDRYSEDLIVESAYGEVTNVGEYDIMKIYNKTEICCLNDFIDNNNDLILVWERKEIDKELLNKIREIAKVVDVIDDCCPSDFGLEDEEYESEKCDFHCFRCWKDTIRQGLSKYCEEL